MIAGRLYFHSCRCPKCNEYVIEDGKDVLDSIYHSKCLVCELCRVEIDGVVHITPEGAIYCEKDFLGNVASVCGGCKQVINSEAVEAMEKQFHVECFKCTEPGCAYDLIANETFHVFEDMPYCPEHFGIKNGDLCCKCGAGICPDDKTEVMDKIYHVNCLCCHVCNNHLGGDDPIYPVDNNPVCETCFSTQTEKCPTCLQPFLTGEVIKVLGRKYHHNGTCFACAACLAPFGESDKKFQRDGWPVCLRHATTTLTPEMEERLKRA
jgi:hypothetical protein